MIFDNLYKNKNVIHEDEKDDDDYTINEPDDGGENPPDDQGGENPPQDNPDDGGEEDDYTIQDGEGQDDNSNNNDQGEDDLPQDNPDDGDEDDDYTIQDEPDDSESDGDPDDNSNNDPDDGEGEDESDDPRAKLNALEKSIFDQLSPEQQEAKLKELKSLFTLAYDKCDTIIDIINNTSKDATLAKVYDYIVSRLSDLKKYITDYLTNVFDNKTYLENMTEFNKYLAVFDTVRNIFEDIQKRQENS